MKKRVAAVLAALVLVVGGLIGSAAPATVYTDEISADTEAPIKSVEEQVKEKLLAWDKRVQQDVKTFLSYTSGSEKIKDWNPKYSFENEFGFEFKKTVLIDLINLIAQEQPTLADQIKQQGLTLHPLSKNGLLYEYLRIQYKHPNASREEGLAHFRQSVRGKKVRVSTDIKNDLVPAEHYIIRGAHQFPEVSFLTPKEKTERRLKQLDEKVYELSARCPDIAPPGWVNTLIAEEEVPAGLDFILIDLFHLYRKEQSDKSAIAEMDGIIVHPVSRNGLLYEWLLLWHQFPDKTEQERKILFSQSVQQGLTVNRRTALTTVVPRGEEIFLHPPPYAHLLSKPERAALTLMNEYDKVVTDNGGEKEKPHLLFFPLAHTERYQSIFEFVFGVKVEFVFDTLWDIYKTEQPEQAALLEREEGITLHPISRNGLLYEWLRIRYEHPEAGREEFLYRFRQSAKQGDMKINRVWPTAVVPREGTVRIRPPERGEVVHIGLVVEP